MEGATKSALAVAYILPVGPSVTVDFTHTLRPSILSTSAVHRTVAPAPIFCKHRVNNSEQVSAMQTKQLQKLCTCRYLTAQKKQQRLHQYALHAFASWLELQQICVTRLLASCRAFWSEPLNLLFSIWQLHCQPGHVWQYVQQPDVAVYVHCVLCTGCCCIQRVHLSHAAVEPLLFLGVLLAGFSFCTLQHKLGSASHRFVVHF